MSMMAMGKVPMPPGVAIMANVAATNTAQAAPNPKCETCSMAENPT